MFESCGFAFNQCNHLDGELSEEGRRDITNQNRLSERLGHYINYETTPELYASADFTCLSTSLAYMKQYTAALCVLHIIFSAITYMLHTLSFAPLDSTENIVSILTPVQGKDPNPFSRQPEPQVLSHGVSNNLME